MSKPKGHPILQEAPPLAATAADVFVRTGLPLSAYTSAVIRCDRDEDGRWGYNSHPNFQINPAIRVEPQDAAQLSCHSAVWPLKMTHISK